MKILLYIGSLRTGGAEIQLMQMARGLLTRGHEVLVTTMYPGGRYWDDAARTTGLVLTSLFDAKSGVKPLVLWQLVEARTRLRRHLRELAPDVLYSMLHTSNYQALAASGRQRNCRLVWGLRAGDMNLPWFREFARRRCSRLSHLVDAIVANSESSLRWHESIGFMSAHNVAIANGIDTDRFWPDADGGLGKRAEWGVANDVRLIGLVGRLTEAKDHGNFIAAASQLSRVHDKIRFVCVGDGKPAYARRLRNDAERQNLGDRMIWAGEQRDMVAVYSALDLVVSASSHESFPNVVGEAMACDRPCVVTDVGDCRDIVIPEDPVVPAGDPASLARAIEDVLDRQERFFGRRRGRIEREYSVQAMLDRTEDVLRAIRVGTHG